MTVSSASSQERIIERLKEQRDRDDREKTEELDSNKKELKELKERLSSLQGDLSDREVRYLWRHDVRAHTRTDDTHSNLHDSIYTMMESVLGVRNECQCFFCLVFSSP